MTATVEYRDEWKEAKKLKGYSNKEIMAMNKNVNKYLNNLNLKVSKGEFEGYSISFDLSFEGAGNSSEAIIKANNCTYNGKVVGNTIVKGNSTLYQKFKPELRNNSFGEEEIFIVGGMTQDKKSIAMNVEVDQNILILLHEIFHTLGFGHPEGDGTHGIMKYPPKKPDQEDADELSTTPFLN